MMHCKDSLEMFIFRHRSLSQHLYRIVRSITLKVQQNGWTGCRIHEQWFCARSSTEIRRWKNG